MKSTVTFMSKITCAVLCVMLLSSCLFNKYSVVLVVDKVISEDDSFNKQAVDGIDLASKAFDFSSEKRIVKNDDEFVNILDSLSKNTDLVIGIGYKPQDSIIKSAEENPDIKYVSVDWIYDGPLDNVTGISYKVQESSFLVGYIAGMTSKTNKIGFIGGVENESILPFEYGYKAGIKYAEMESGKQIEVQTFYLNNFDDVQLAKNTALDMYSNDIDIIFQAAGGAGTGVIDAASEVKKYVIGVDKDQSYMAPDYVLTSALKNVKSTVYTVIEDYTDGNYYDQKTVYIGLYEGGVGIPDNNPLVDKDVMKRTLELKDLIINGDIVPPTDKVSFETYVENIK